MLLVIVINQFASSQSLVPLSREEDVDPRKYRYHGLRKASFPHSCSHGRPPSSNRLLRIHLTHPLSPSRSLHLLPPRSSRFSHPPIPHHIPPPLPTTTNPVHQPLHPRNIRLPARPSQSLHHQNPRRRESVCMAHSAVGIVSQI